MHTRTGLHNTYALSNQQEGKADEAGPGNVAICTLGKRRTEHPCGQARKPGLQTARVHQDAVARTLPSMARIKEVDLTRAAECDYAFDLGLAFESMGPGRSTLHVK